MTSGKASRTAKKGCRLRTSRQQVQSQYRSRPRCSPLAALRSPDRIASPPLRPWRGRPPPPHAPAAEASLIARFLGPPAPAGSPIPRRRGRTGPDAFSPDARVATVPQPRRRSPGPAAGPLTCTCLRKWRGPGTASGQEQQQQRQQRRWPRHLAHRTAPGPALGSPSVRPSVSRSCLPMLPQRHPRRLLLVTRCVGQTSARLLVRTRRSGHRNTILPARPPAAPPPPLNSSNGSSPAEPRAQPAAFPPP